MGGLAPGLEWVVLVHYSGTRRVVFVWGTLDSCSRSVVGGLEMCVFDGANTWSRIRPGHEFSTRSTQFIRRWGLLRESARGTVHW